MDYVNLGRTGLQVSRICLGMMSYGIADVYSAGASETATGRLLGKMFTREEVVVATKVHGATMPGPNGRGLSRKHSMDSIDASLERLDMDYVDLYQIHRWDDRTPIEETKQPGRPILTHVPVAL